MQRSILTCSSISLFGTIYYRLLMKSAPLTEASVDQLLAQVMQGKRRVVQKRSK
jgi:hypothetical protein